MPWLDDALESWQLQYRHAYAIAAAVPLLLLAAALWCIERWFSMIFSTLICGSTRRKRKQSIGIDGASGHAASRTHCSRFIVAQWWIRQAATLSSLAFIMVLAAFDHVDPFVAAIIACGIILKRHLLHGASSDIADAAGVKRLSQTQVSGMSLASSDQLRHASLRKRLGSGDRSLCDSSSIESRSTLDQESPSLNISRAFIIKALCIQILCYSLSFGICGICIPDEPNWPVSTAATRSIQRFFTQTPASAPFRHVYATLADNLCEEIIINFHSKPDWFPSTLERDTSAIGSFIELTDIARNRSRMIHGTHRLFWDGNHEVPRIVHRVLLQRLAHQTYRFRAAICPIAGSQNDCVFSTDHEFTMPPCSASEQSPIVFVAGGDFGAYPETVLLTQQIRHSIPLPHFAVLGGDLAYDDGFITCYDRFDLWLDMWLHESIIGHASDGTPRILPFTSAIGNHDAGGFGLAHQQVPHFFKYFALQNDDVTSWHTDKRPSAFHEHTIGSLLQLLMLDSDVVDSVLPGSPQWSWLRDRLSPPTLRNDERISSKKNPLAFALKIVSYHVPMFPSRRKLEDSKASKIRESWLAPFSEGRVSLVLEHHDHAYKRTVPIRTSNESGIVFVGDGMWGMPVAEDAAKRAQHRHYDAKVADKSHFLRIEIGIDTARVTARGLDGHAFDDFSIALNVPR